TTLALIKAKTDNLDVLLSSRGSEATLATRASEATLTIIRNAVGALSAVIPANAMLSGAKDSSGNLAPLEVVLVDNHYRLRTYPISRDYFFASRQQLFTFSQNVNAASAGTINPLILLRNPAGSGKKLIFDHLEFGMIVKGTQATIYFYKNPTVTTPGTLQTIQNLWIGAGPTASVMQVYTLPTISANGQQIGTMATGKDTASEQWDKQFGIILNPGYDLLFSADPDANNRLLGLTATWGEEA
ncbi:MAG: hypothetical protein ACWGQW_08810, partial [bacterium]